MAGSEVIRDLGETLVDILRAGIPSVMVDPLHIFVATPDDFTDLENPQQPTLTVFLYRVGVNPQMRNAPRKLLPDGRTTRQPLPLELSFLVTAWAKDTRDELLIIGRVLQILYDHAELGASELIGTSWESDDTLQIVLESLPLEDHYRIWDASEIPYRLSLTYMARVVGISPTEALQPPPVVEAYIGGRA